MNTDHRGSRCPVVALAAVSVTYLVIGLEVVRADGLVALREVTDAQDGRARHSPSHG